MNSEQPQWKYGDIDYARVRSSKDLASWAIETFNMPATGTEVASRRFILAIFEHIGLQGYRFEIRELNTHLQSFEVASLLDGQDGWKQILRFHAHRDYGVYVRFVE